VYKFRWINSQPSVKTRTRPTDRCENLMPAFVSVKAWVCDRLPAGIEGSNPADRIDFFLLWMLCLFKGAGGWSLVQTYRVWCVWVWSRNLINEEAMAHQGCRFGGVGGELRARNLRIVWLVVVLSVVAWYLYRPLALLPCKSSILLWPYKCSLLHARSTGCHFLSLHSSYERSLLSHPPT
jgi:hypothetical protein